MSREALVVKAGSKRINLYGEQKGLYKALEEFPFLCSTCASRSIGIPSKNAAGSLKHLVDKKVVKRFKSKDCHACGRTTIKRNIYYPSITSYTEFGGTVLAGETTKKTIVKKKECARCHKPLPLSDFSKSAASKDGHQAYCRACQKDYDSKRPPRPHSKHLKTEKEPKKETRTPKKVVKEKYYLFSPDNFSSYDNVKELEKEINILLSDGYEYEDITIIKGREITFETVVKIEE